MQRPTSAPVLSNFSFPGGPAFRHSGILEFDGCRGGCGGGLLVFGDSKDGSRNITLRTRYILIKDGGALHIGAEKCRYKSKATVVLYGKSDEGESMPTFGKKFIGVEAGGTLELHGAQKVSWTLLVRTLHSSGLIFGSYAFEKNFLRGLNVRVIDQDTAKILEIERFDTHEYHNESRRLQEFLRVQDPGRIVAIAVGDSAAKSLLQGTIQMIQDRLGSKLIQGLGYRQAWALVGVIDGGSTSCNESVRNYENHSSGGKALAQREFYTVDGQKFAVTAYSEWIEGFWVEVVDGVKLHLLDDVSSWKPGDQIVVASTDYSMYQAEEFTLLPCPECSRFQVKVKETPKFLHMGEIVDGVDMRAEVGILTRNVVIQGEMEDSCYGENQCQFFDYDTFGGHVMIKKNFTSVHLSHVELKHMGQQHLGRYPVHFHLCGDVDYKGGYRHATFVDGLSIHHSFSRCITVHGTNGLLIKDTIGFDTLGHCFFLEDGIEQRNTLFHNLGLLTKPGTLLPTDRNNSMCTTMREKVFGNYVPVPATDCIFADNGIGLTFARCTFKKFVPTPDRYTSAVGFLMKNSWQITPRNNISLVKFGPHVFLNVFFGKPGPWFEDCELDGDKNSIFHDIDGSVTGYKDAYVGRIDNYLIRHPSCVNVTKWNAVVCSGNYAQVYVQTWSTQNLTMTIARDEYPAYPMVLRGINQKATFPQYQPVIMLEKGYTIHWNGPAPRTAFLYLINFNKNDWIRVGLCYPSNTSFQVTFGFLQRHNGSLSKMEEYEPVHSLEELQRKPSERKFYFDSSTGLLFLYLKAKSHRDGHSYCSSQGCERVKIQAATDSKDISNCMAKAYPRYYRKPSALKPMPSMLKGLCQGCGTRQINGTDFTFRSEGILLLIVDACSVPFRLTEKKVFSLADVSRLEEYLKRGIPPRSWSSSAAGVRGLRLLLRLRRRLGCRSSRAPAHGLGASALPCSGPPWPQDLLRGGSCVFWVLVFALFPLPAHQGASTKAGEKELGCEEGGVAPRVVLSSLSSSSSAFCLLDTSCQALVWRRAPGPGRRRPGALRS
ncbi:transmembrane protein 2 [Camelus ferus]|nr:transmembrane protein 2 [Camelus ferus]